MNKIYNFFRKKTEVPVVDFYAIVIFYFASFLWFSNRLLLIVNSTLFLIQVITIIVYWHDAFSEWPEYRTQEETKQLVESRAYARRQIKVHAILTIFFALYVAANIINLVFDSQ